MRKSFVAVAGVAILAIVIVAGLFLVRGRGESYAFQGGELTPAQPAPPLPLEGPGGEPFDVAGNPGGVTLLFFGYTTCPDICPTTINDFVTVKEDLGPLADRVRFVLVSVDPERDTHERLAEYLGFFDDSFIGLRGDEAQTETAKLGYGATSQRVEYPDSSTKYLIDHSSLVYLIDPAGNLRATYPYGTDPAAIAADVRHLLENEA